MENAQRTYFFERHDGSTFNVDPVTAWTLYSKGTQIVGYERVRPKFIGTSDGVTYAKAVQESQKILKEQGLEAAQEFLRKAWNEELELARQDRTPPPNFDEIDRLGRPTVIKNL